MSVVRLIVATRSSGPPASQPVITEMPGSVASGTLFITWCMSFASWINKTTNTYSEYVIFIAFPLQKWLRERAPVLRYTCIASLVEDYLDEFRLQSVNK